MKITVRGHDAWSAEIDVVPLTPAALEVEVVLLVNDEWYKTGTFGVGTALDSEKYDHLERVEAWLETACGSRGLKWAVLSIIAGLLAGPEFTADVEPGEYKFYPVHRGNDYDLPATLPAVVARKRGR